MDPDRPRRGWVHAPGRRCKGPGLYCLTSATLDHALIFCGPHLKLLHDELRSAVAEAGWKPHVWCVFPNHYHVVVEIGRDALPLRVVVSKLHSQTSRLVNTLDRKIGRRVWFNYWDTKLFTEEDLSNRIAYVHFNAVRHGVVDAPESYPYSSAGCGVELPEGSRDVDWEKVEFDSEIS